MNGSILVIDGDLPLCETLRMACSSLDCELFCASDEKTAHEMLAARSYSTVFCETRFLAGEPNKHGHELRQRFGGALLVLTGDQKREALAHDALLHDAFAMLLKPASLPEVTWTVRRAFELQRTRRLREGLERELHRNTSLWPIVAASEPMIALLEDLERASDSETHILLEGEYGTEKNAIARMIHAQSTRRGEPFVALDCTRTAPEDVHRELFGDTHGRAHSAGGRRVGALSSSRGGSIFLDRPDTLAEDAQATLATFLDVKKDPEAPHERSTPRGFRLIAAIPPSSTETTASPRLTADLEQPLRAMTLRIPALRERTRDIPLLADHFLRSFGRSLQKPKLSFRDRTLEHLIAYPWPGNILELENLVERIALVASHGPIGPDLLPEAVRQEAALASPASSGSYLRYARQCAEIAAIEQALVDTEGNRTHAARRLGISHRSLLYKIKQYRLGN